MKYKKENFIIPPWKAIYRNDGERDQSFEEAISSYETLSDWYGEMGYEPVILSFDDVERRVEFILRSIGL